MVNSELHQHESSSLTERADTDSLNAELEADGSSSGSPMNKYQVHVSISIGHELEPYNVLSFNRRFVLEGRRFSDIAAKVDFLYDTIEGVNVNTD